MVSCISGSNTEVHIETTFCTTCKANKLDLPYSHKQLAEPAKVVIELEFEGSMGHLMPQLMQMLGISKTLNLAERDDLLQVRPFSLPTKG